MNKRQIIIAASILFVGIAIFVYFAIYQGQQEDALDYSNVITNTNAEN